MNISAVISWIKANKGAVLTGAFVVLLGFILGGAFIVQSRDVERQSWYLLYKAQILAFQGQAQDAHRIITELQTRYPKSKVRDFTLLLEATLLSREGNWGAAIEKYQTLIDRQKVKPLVPLAKIGLAKAFEATNAPDKAIETYQEFISAHSDHFALPHAYEGLARLYEAKNDLAKSKEYLERIRVLYPESIWSKHAETRLRMLVK